MISSFRRGGTAFSGELPQARTALLFVSCSGQIIPILGDPGADSVGEGKSKRAEKYGMKKSKERRDEPLRTMSYRLELVWKDIVPRGSSRRSLLFFLPYFPPV